MKRSSPTFRYTLVVAPLCPLGTTVVYITGPAGVLEATFTDFGYDLSGSITMP